MTKNLDPSNRFTLKNRIQRDPRGNTQLLNQSPVKKLLVSTLTFGRLDNVSKLAINILPMLDALATTNGLVVTMVIRNNDTNVDIGDMVADITAHNETCVAVDFISGEANTGFGRGHNENLRLHPADYILILNDDLGFPDLNWLPHAISMFESDPLLALIGDSGNPQFLNPSYGNGVYPGGGRQYPIRYAEASVLLGRASLFCEIGMFDESFEWAMCEDADLSLAVQSLGYRIDWIPIPHQHWRSSTFNRLSPEIKSSILEHNRAKLFAKWSNSLSTGAVGRHSIIDLWSDGIGDIFCALPHLLGYLESLPIERQKQFIINTNHVDFVRAFLPTTVEVVSRPSLEELVSLYKKAGIASVRSIRRLNYSLPVNIHALISGALGLPVARERALKLFREKLLSVSHARSDLRVPESYCVFHSEFQREGHDGRSMSPDLRRRLLAAVAQRYHTVVVIGREVITPTDGLVNVIDLQGKLSIYDLVLLFNSASASVGIDSFPAHLAQAMGIPSVIFYGSVHPLARIWSEASVAPLVAKLDCIGCYHKHIEPSIPFCMRRDLACETELTSSDIEETLESLKGNINNSYRALNLTWQEIQARQIEMQVYHPNAKIATAYQARVSNDATSNLIYELVDKILGQYETQRGSEVIESLEQQLHRLQKRLSSSSVELADKDKQLKMLIRERNAQMQRARSVNVELSDSLARFVRCDVSIHNSEISVVAFAPDPQLHLQPITLSRGNAYLKIYVETPESDQLEVFWALGDHEFEQENSVAISISPNDLGVHLVKIPIGKSGPIRLRIDPLKGEGHIKMKLRLLGLHFQDLGMDIDSFSEQQEPLIDSV